MNKDDIKLPKQLYYDILIDNDVNKKLSQINSKTKYVIDHGILHTKHVCNYVKQICKVLNIKSDELYLCLIAGYLHDIGRFFSQENHSTYSAEFAKEYLRNKLKEEYVNQICEAIYMHEKDKFDYTTKNVCAWVVILADKMDYTRSRFIKELIDEKAKEKVYYNIKKIELSNENDNVILTITKYRNSKNIDSKFVYFITDFYKKIFKHFDKNLILVMK